MKSVKYLAILAALALLTPLGALARDKNAHSVSITDAVQVGSAQLKPGDYRVEWQESGPTVNVKFSKNGKTVATVPATLKTNDTQIIADSVVTERTSAATNVLKEIDFNHQKEALIFSQQSGM
jgi:hypothetical protein